MGRPPYADTYESRLKNEGNLQAITKTAQSRETMTFARWSQCWSPLRSIFALSVLIAVSAPARAEFLTPFWITEEGKDVAAAAALVAAPKNVAMLRSCGNKAATSKPDCSLRAVQADYSSFRLDSYITDLAVDGNGNAHYGWRDGGGLRTRTLSADGVLAPLFSSRTSSHSFTSQRTSRVKPSSLWTGSPGQKVKTRTTAPRWPHSPGSSR